MRKIYKVGVIGTGDISTQYLTNAKNVKMFKDYYQIVAVADLVVEKAQAKAAEFGIPKYGLPETVYDDPEIEIILNLTVPNAHEEVNIKALESGKPEKIVDKIVEGQIEKYYKEVCLLEQVFVKDGDKTIKGLVAEVSKAVGAPIDVVRYARFERGEGIEKRKDNLAEEIAKMAQ